MLTFTLIVGLLYPSGLMVEIEMGFGLTYEKCEAARARAVLQLPQTLSTARLHHTGCKAERSA